MNKRYFWKIKKALDTQRINDKSSVVKPFQFKMYYNHVTLLKGRIRFACLRKI